MVTFDLEGLHSKKAASVDMEVGLKKAQDKPPSSWVKRWPRCAPYHAAGLLDQSCWICVNEGGQSEDGPGQPTQLLGPKQWPCCPPSSDIVLLDALVPFFINILAFCLHHRQSAILMII